MRYQLRATKHGAFVGAALVCGLTLAIVDLEHIRRDRVPSHWDEAGYVNRTCADRFNLIEQGFVRFAENLIRENRNAPPAYRIDAVPTFIIAGPNLGLLR